MVGGKALPAAVPRRVKHIAAASCCAKLQVKQRHSLCSLTSSMLHPLAEPHIGGAPSSTLMSAGQTFSKHPDAAMAHETLRLDAQETGAHYPLSIMASQLGRQATSQH